MVVTKVPDESYYARCTSAQKKKTDPIGVEDVAEQSGQLALDARGVGREQPWHADRLRQQRRRRRSPPNQVQPRLKGALYDASEIGKRLARPQAKTKHAASAKQCGARKKKK